LLLGVTSEPTRNIVFKGGSLGDGQSKGCGRRSSSKDSSFQIEKELGKEGKRPDESKLVLREAMEGKMSITIGESPKGGTKEEELREDNQKQVSIFGKGRTILVKSRERPTGWQRGHWLSAPVLRHKRKRMLAETSPSSREEKVFFLRMRVTVGWCRTGGSIMKKRYWKKIRKCAARARKVWGDYRQAEQV